MQKKQEDQFNRYSEEQKKKEGEVTIKHNQKPHNSTTESGIDSEYVDFEEIN